MVTTAPDIFKTTAYLLLDLPTTPKIILPLPTFTITYYYNIILNKYTISIFLSHDTIVVVNTYM